MYTESRKLSAYLYGALIGFTIIKSEKKYLEFTKIS